MKKELIVVGLVAIATMAHADIYVSTQKTPNSTPLWTNEGSAFYSGNELYNYCGSSSSSFGNAFCEGYIAGAADILQNQNANAVCIPKAATVGQVKDVVEKYLTNHPESRHFGAWSLILMALEESFPCKPS